MSEEQPVNPTTSPGTNPTSDAFDLAPEEAAPPRPAIPRAAAPPPPAEKPAESAASPDSALPQAVLAPRRPLAKPLFLAGLIVTVAAMVAAGVTAKDNPAGWIALTVYNIALHSALGVACAWALARLEERRLGDWREAWARTLLAVAILMLLLRVRLPVQPEIVERTLRALAALGVYFVSVAVLFRWSARRVLQLTAMQFVAWAIVALGVAADRWVRATP
jgi:uncharacterized membrane protein